MAWNEAVWCSSAADSLEATITVSGTEITRIPREQGFKALGLWVTFYGHFMIELARTAGNCVALFLCPTTIVMRQQSGR